MRIFEQMKNWDAEDWTLYTFLGLVFVLAALLVGGVGGAIFGSHKMHGCYLQKDEASNPTIKLYRDVEWEGDHVIASSTSASYLLSLAERMQCPMDY